MRLIPHDLLIKMAAQQCPRTGQVHARELLQGRAVPCKAEALALYWETEENGEVAEDTSLGLNVYWSWMSEQLDLLFQWYSFEFLSV